MKLITRTVSANISKQLNNPDDHKIIIIYGARQVGKTTLVKQLMYDNNLKTEYFNCDYLDVQSLFAYKNAANLKYVLRDLELIVLDEAQRIPDIGMTLKIIYDEHPKLKIIATGSSSFDLSNKINEPLTGRKIVYRLYPLTYKELSDSRSVMDSRRLLSRVFRFGSYPSVILNNDRIALENLNEIVSSYLFKDVLQFQHLKKPDILIDLLRLIAFQISNEVSYTELARKLRVDQTVIQRYLQLLEDSFIIFRLNALKKNLRNEIGKSRKIYFWDLGVRNVIIQNTNPVELRDDIGALWENFCIAERQKVLHNILPSLARSYFWRNYNQKEIDYIEETGQTYHAYEFKWSSRKRVKFPNDFINGYPDSSFNVVTPENIDSFLLSTKTTLYISTLSIAAGKLFSCHTFCK